MKKAKKDILATASGSSVDNEQNLFKNIYSSQEMILRNLKEQIMASEHPKDNQKCKSDEHTEHLCYFVSYGYHVDNEEEYKGLVEEPRYKCHFCGRTAHLEESLCKPMKL